MKELSESRVLIVDDLKANVEVLIHNLRDEYKLSFALDGEGALRSVEKNPPDLVLLDIMMPGMDGYDVCRRLRASPQTREIPVMFLSALEDVQNKTLGFEAGGNDYLTKPFEIQEVKARVRSLLKAKAYSDAVKEKVASELRIAREIQMGLLPTDLAARTRGTPLDIHAVLGPARQVGGDLYDVIRPDADRVVVVVGDVSGKGIPAALFMAVTLTLVRSMSRELKQPDEILRRVNEELAAQNPHGLFVTLVCASFDLRDGCVTCASAGHQAPALLRDGEAPRLVLREAGTVAGVFPELEFPSETMTLQPGDHLVFYTDGVTEAFDPQERLFGEDRLILALGRESGQTAAETVLKLLRAVRCHAGESPQSDDITIVAVRYTP
jgi:sigma-B regulation protein RsbU (phosphoserine phosphatase)